MTEDPRSPQPETERIITPPEPHLPGFEPDPPQQPQIDPPPMPDLPDTGEGGRVI